MTSFSRPEPVMLSRMLAPLARAWRSYWLFPALLILLILGLTVGLRIADAAGLSAWLHGRGLVIVDNSDTMRDWSVAITGAFAALATLYISITLIVLTLAAGNLGVRLIDRWTTRPFIRVTLGLLMGGLAGSAA